MKRFPDELIASTEALLYGGVSPLYADLQAIYQDVLAGDQAALTRVTKAIRHHTHMDIAMQLVDSPVASLEVLFIPFNVNSVLRDPAFSGLVGATMDVSALSKTLSGKGAVDKQGRVSGVFTKLPARIVISTATLREGVFTAEELAAFTLHEIGHVYHYFDTIGSTIVASSVISSTLAVLNQTDDLATRKQAVEDAVKTLRFTDVDTAALAAAGEEKAFEGIMIRHTVLALSADQGSPQLFNGEAEYLADSYAVRMGAGGPLTTGYMKLAKLYGKSQLDSHATYLRVEATKVALIVISGFAGLLIVPAALIAALSIALGSNAMLNRNTPVERLEAVHGDMVAILKDRALPKEFQESIITDIKLVSSLREQLTEHQTLVSYLWLAISPARRKLYKQIQLQRDIGKLVNTDLFTKAAELATLKRK